MNIAEKMAADIALAMDGGEWKDGKWYSKFHRDAWIKAVKPYADEIERLRSDEKKYQAIISKLIAKKVADEYWSKILQDDDFDPWAALKEGE